MTGSPGACAPDPALARLDAALIALHRSGDAAGLADLHERTAAALAADPGARRFQLTHAWVFALEAGDEARVRRLEAALRRVGGL